MATISPESAFQTAAGFSTDEISTLIVGIIGMVIFLWQAWIALSNYQSWSENKNDTSFYTVLWSIIRSIFVTAVILYLIN